MATSGTEIGFLLAPVGVLVGGAAGGFYGIPKEETEADTNALLRACADTDLQKSVRREVVAAIQKRTRYPLAQSGTGTRARANSRLELDVLDAGLCGSQFKGAMVSLYIRVRTRLVACPDGAMLYDHVWLHSSGARTFNQWAAKDARAFRQELAIASRTVANSLVEGIFLGLQPQSHGSIRGNHHLAGLPQDAGTAASRHRDWQSSW
jgi:hypothetical protein